ncbi:hypothetical protein LZZ90_10150 [Flavobacterium sp. SM15]|uniref:hypothetical protein n=1 Tax=Flavobacterium sp. SM15 TaxID=2908005 RepID=UPI001EDC13C6|nr:hypothetical protein [Flavobacterium sp. SM15]MCG2611866.1 hypothetical protein [Flavobacterium sp. SM15]
MRIALQIAAAAFLFTSCDFILKDHSKDDEVIMKQNTVVVGNDKDDKGCVTSAGYMWSEVRKGCIRVFEEGYRLAPYKDQAEASEEDNEQATLNAYIVFSNDKNVAELFLPNETKSVLLQREAEGKPYLHEDWMLESWKGYVLKKSGKIQYVSAIAKEKKFTGSDTGE